jgi:hypothetical protein
VASVELLILCISNDAFNYTRYSLLDDWWLAILKKTAVTRVSLNGNWMLPSFCLDDPIP